MRYSSEPTMNDRSLRDVERWKDKIEVRLDNRQVFFLFFGSALVACLLFILGVIVGKRLESRGKAVAPEIEDPLALLDKVAASPLAAASEPPARPAPPSVPVPPRSASRPVPPAPHLAEAPRPAEPVRSIAAPPAEKPAAEKPAAEKPPAALSVARLELPPRSEPAPLRNAPAAAAPVAVAEWPRGKGRFALQLGSFPDQAEAEAFARQFGSPVYVVPSEIPGRGLWYRVRVGDYPSAREAITAKTTFEKQHSVIAYVVGPTPGK
jgi:DedD protein